MLLQWIETSDEITLLTEINFSGCQIASCDKDSLQTFIKRIERIRKIDTEELIGCILQEKFGNQARKSDVIIRRCFIQKVYHQRSNKRF